MIKKLLVRAPHTNDGEPGCGGTITRLLSEDCEVCCAAFSACEESVPAGYDKDVLRREYLLGLARAHGVQIGREYAEVFETVRWIL